MYQINIHYNNYRLSQSPYKLNGRALSLEICPTFYVALLQFSFHFEII